MIIIKQSIIPNQQIQAHEVSYHLSFITHFLIGMYLQQSHQLPLTDCVNFLLGYNQSVKQIWHQMLHPWKQMLPLLDTTNHLRQSL